MASVHAPRRGVRGVSQIWKEGERWWKEETCQLKEAAINALARFVAFLLLVVRPGAPSSDALAPNADAESFSIK